MKLNDAPNDAKINWIFLMIFFENLDILLEGVRKMDPILILNRVCPVDNIPSTN